MFSTLLQVALGGALGASARYLTGVAAVRVMGHGFPWGTLIVNAVGSALMGVMVVVMAHKMGSTKYAHFLMTGVLGGFTTFSAFSLDALTLYERGQAGAAAAYVAGTLALTLGGILAGVLLARALYA